MLVAAACSTTPTQVKSESPKFSIESSKDTKTIAACITDRMVAKYHRLGNTVTSRMTTGGYVVQYDYVSPMGGSTGMVLEVIEAANGKSKSTGYFTSGIRGYFVEDAEAATRDCSK
ncbi:MAG: hypothetical protein KA435_10400 [Azonexus sp.]|nr:hypothetical protein [Azonexus sp.]MBP6203448.1 hypothetical protein [Azonexus sp.]